MPITINQEVLIMKANLYIVLAVVLALLSGCAGCSTEQEEQVDMAAFALSIMENYTFSGFVERMEPTDEDFGAYMLANYYPGLTDLDLEQLEAYLCVVAMNSGDLILVQARDSDNAAKAKEIFEARIAAATDRTVVNYPDTVENWTCFVEVVDHGDYVMLVCNKDCDDIVEDFRLLFEN